MGNQKSYTAQVRQSNERNLLREHNLRSQREKRKNLALSFNPLQMWLKEENLRNKGGEK